MKLIKALLAAAIAASLLVLPAGALAKSRDRDHDRMSDKWEKKHHLNPRVKDARRDPDKDHLSNLSEFRHDTDPQNADTDDDGVKDDDEVRDHTNPLRRDSDDDGIDDDDEIAGTIVSFANGVLTIQLPGEGDGTVSGAVNDATEIECEDDDDDRTASASDDGSGDNSGPGSGSDDRVDNSGPGSNSSGPGPDGDDDDQGEDEDDDRACTASDLKASARVHEAELGKATDGSTIFKEIELVPTS